MRRYGREYGRYDRGLRGATPRRYGSDYERDYEGGWGMTGLYNRIMREPVRGRFGYGSDYRGQRPSRYDEPPLGPTHGQGRSPVRRGFRRSYGPRYDRGWF